MAKTQLNAFGLQLADALLKAGVGVYHANYRKQGRVDFTSAADIFPWRDGVRFEFPKPSAFITLIGDHAGKVSFREAIPSLAKMSVRRVAGNKLLVNAYQATGKADQKSMVATIVKLAAPGKVEPKAR